MGIPLSNETKKNYLIFNMYNKGRLAQSKAMEIFDLICSGLIERRTFRAKFVTSPLRPPLL